VQAPAYGHGRTAVLRSLARRREKIHGVWKFNTIPPYHPSHAVNDLCALPFMAVDCCLHRRLRRKLLALAVDGRVRMLRSLARRRQKMHWVSKCNNITPYHPSRAVDDLCALPSMAVDCCLHRRLRRKLLGSPPSVQAPAYGHGRTGTEGINGVGRVGRDYIVNDGRVRMLRSLARRRQKMHGVWKFNNIIPSHPSHAVDPFYTAIDGKCVEFFFFISFSAVGAGTSLRPWTDGHRRYQRRGKGGKGLSC
jgi:hypothetical protein